MGCTIVARDAPFNLRDALKGIVEDGDVERCVDFLNERANEESRAAEALTADEVGMAAFEAIEAVMAAYARFPGMVVLAAKYLNARRFERAEGGADGSAGSLPFGSLPADPVLAAADAAVLSKVVADPSSGSRG